MRRLMLAILLASSVAVPAMAQDRGFGGHERDHGTREAPNEQRQEAREARRAERAAERQPEALPEATAPRQMTSQQSDAPRSRNRSVLGQVMEQSRRGDGHVEVRGDQHHDRRRGGHGEYHRDVNREHRDLHASDPTRREHRGWHRDVNRQHDRRHDSWNNGWRNDRSYDWRDYRHRNRSVFRLGNYYDPYGSRYRRFSIGISLFPNYYQSNYWLSDPWQYRLPPAYGPYRWVRYYDDALLVNIYTGQVVDVEYNFFW